MKYQINLDCLYGGFYNWGCFSNTNDEEYGANLGIELLGKRLEELLNYNKDSYTCYKDNEQFLNKVLNGEITEIEGDGTINIEWYKEKDNQMKWVSVTLIPKHLLGEVKNHYRVTVNSLIDLPF